MEPVQGRMKGKNQDELKIVAQHHFDSALQNRVVR